MSKCGTCESVYHATDQHEVCLGYFLEAVRNHARMPPVPPGDEIRFFEIAGKLFDALRVVASETTDESSRSVANAALAIAQLRWPTVR